MTPTPHDALFRSTFSHPGRAAELLRSFLDPDLCSRIDWPGLTLQSGSFVDEQLRAQHTDLLFTARLDDRELRIYLLLEHQSNPDRWIALWLLRYMVRIWVAHVDAHPRTPRLPLILPAVIHHGEKAWTIDPTFSALFDIPDGFTNLIPRFQFALADLATIDAETLRTRAGSAAVRMALLALKETREAEDLQALLLSWATLLNQLEREPDGPRVIELVFRYLWTVRDTRDIRSIDLPALGLSKTSEALMTHETYLLNRGKQAIILQQLRSKFSRLPPAIVTEVEAADSDTLQRWGLRLLTADTLDEVFAA